jgi:hypothetical protein
MRCQHVWKIEKNSPKLFVPCEAETKILFKIMDIIFQDDKS